MNRALLSPTTTKTTTKTKTTPTTTTTTITTTTTTVFPSLPSPPGPQCGLILPVSPLPAVPPQVSLEQAGEGQRRLGQVCQEAERLVQHLPRAGAAQVQEHLAACQRAWSDYELGCSRSGRELEQSRELLHR